MLSQLPALPYTLERGNTLEMRQQQRSYYMYVHDLVADTLHFQKCLGGRDSAGRDETIAVKLCIIVTAITRSLTLHLIFMLQVYDQTFHLVNKHVW